jgi:hypothetical protein
MIKDVFVILTFNIFWRLDDWWHRRTAITPGEISPRWLDAQHRLPDEDRL